MSNDKHTSVQIEVQRDNTFSGAPFTNITLRPVTPYTSSSSSSSFIVIIVINRTEKDRPTLGEQITLMDLRVRLNSRVALRSYLLRQ